MWADLVEETANSPGTNATVSLLGAIDGRRSFIGAFGDGETCYYELASGNMWEIGMGLLAAGSPNTLTRSVVMRNSAGTTARLNFVGTVRVFNTLPADRALWQDAAGVFRANTRQIVGLGAATSGDHVPRYDQLGEVLIRSDVYTAPISGWSASLPGGFARFRVEWEDAAPAAGSPGLYFRLSINGGASYLQGASDYPCAGTLSNGVSVLPVGGANAWGVLGGDTGAANFGSLEFQPHNIRAWIARNHTRDSSANHQAAVISGWAPASGTTRATHILLSFINQSIGGGRFRLKGIL